METIILAIGIVILALAVAIYILKRDGYYRDSYRFNAKNMYYYPKKY